MFKKYIAILLCIITAFSTAVIFTGCGEKVDYPVTVDSLEIKEEPKNIVILSKNVADIVSCIGYDKKIIGRSEEVNQKGMKVVPVVGTASTPDVAKIKKLKADLVLGDDLLSEASKEELEKNKIPYLVIDDAQTSKQVKNIYKKIGTALGGQVTGREKEKKAVTELFDTMKDVQYAVKQDKIVKTVCYLYVDNGNLMTMNDGTWGNTLLGFTNATNIFENSKTNVVDTDQLILANPDYIFCSSTKLVKYLKTHSAFKKLSALKKNTFVIENDEIEMQGNTSLDVLQTMIKDMYPQQISSN